MNGFPNTIVEIYDEEPIYNVLSVSEFKPTNAVYLGSQKLKNKKARNRILSHFRSTGINTKCFFYPTDMHSISSIIAELENIFSIFGDIAIDVTGGNETALIAIGMFVRDRNVPLFGFDYRKGCYRNIFGFSIIDGTESKVGITVNSVLTLHGGAMKSHGHVSLDGLTKEAEEDIFNVWDIYAAHHREWNRTVSYLQHISKNLYDNELRINNSKGIILGEKSIASANRSIMDKLYDRGIIVNYKNNPKNISFKYKNQLMKSCLTDIGICLELYVYASAIKSSLFDDVQISVVIDWDGKLDDKINTINEIDVIITHGVVPLFVSCKSGIPTVIALNEIKMLAKRFGGALAKPVLVTMSDVCEKDKYLCRRAEDMNVTIIGRDDLLSGNLINRLTSVIKN